MEWQLIDSGKLSPQAIMAKDEELLKNLQQESLPILHLYDWSAPCLTYGYFIDPQKYLNLEALQNYQIGLARRPTGGGIIFHLTDLAFSVLLPSSYPGYSVNTLENYALVNRQIAHAIAGFKDKQATPVLLSKISSHEADYQGFCMAKPTQYDLIIDEKKVGGAAQRRTKQGLLHQGSLSLALLPEELLKNVLKNQEVTSAIKQQSYCLLPEAWTDQDLRQARQTLRDLIQMELTKRS
ncbi:lipoyl protein ligase domain-containing protein [Candidatus Protochlamydia sp. W-9]|uniref:lipoyl protein ligase domain-containing protein n=1 Tax=Candidatus Protochlamydia sp. W-9 TaxID=1785087 RepID=UPI00096A7F1F|nr:hypothetical protein [Candidatus Protochlamydia sp. W-9]